MNQRNDRTHEEMTARLLAELRARGIAYLSGGYESAGEAVAHPMPDADLLRTLAGCSESRVRNAAISLLLLHPDLVAALPEALSASDALTAESLVTLALAALYMSRLWYTRLRLALGHAPELRDNLLTPLIATRGLPKPDELHGELGLRALEHFEQARRGVRYNFLSDWQNQTDQLIAHERLRRRAAQRAQRAQASA